MAITRILKKKPAKKAVAKKSVTIAQTREGVAFTKYRSKCGGVSDTGKWMRGFTPNPALYALFI